MSFLLFVFIVAYFLPTIIAFSRNHNNEGAIFVLNMFLGWTALGWIMSLAWAVFNATDAK